MPDRTITAITEFDDEFELEGYEITLASGEKLGIGISSGQSCCENYGYATTEDDLQSFIGATMLEFDIVDQELAVQQNKLADSELYDVPYIDCGDIIFLNVITDRGTLQFSVYNSHNGYYGHEALIKFGEQTLFEAYF